MNHKLKLSLRTYRFIFIACCCSVFLRAQNVLSLEDEGAKEKKPPATHRIVLLDTHGGISVDDIRSKFSVRINSEQLIAHDSNETLKLRQKEDGRVVVKHNRTGLKIVLWPEDDAEFVATADGFVIDGAFVQAKVTLVNEAGCERQIIRRFVVEKTDPSLKE